MAVPIDIAKDVDFHTTQFIKKLNEVYDLELAAKRKVEGPEAILTEKEISRLRNSPDLGLWNSNGKPISVEHVNAHFRWRNEKQLSRSDKSPLKLKEVKPKKIEGYNRPYLESQDSLTREAKSWINRLDGKDWYDSRRRKTIKGTGKKLWPPGLTRKNILQEVARAANETGEYNAKLAAELGFNFEKGHGWAVMGPANKRTWVVPYYGNRMEGHFSFRNVAPQPAGSTLRQLLDPFWNAIIPNVPPAHSKHGVQISSAAELKWAGGGGQGWLGTMEDILLRASPDLNIDDFDKLPLEQKAYVLFADPDRGGGANPEARYFEIKNGQWDNVQVRLAENAATAVPESGKVTDAPNLFDGPFVDPELLPTDLDRATIVELDAIENLPLDERRKAVKALVKSGKLNLDNYASKSSGWFTRQNLLKFGIPTLTLANAVRGAKTLAAGITPDVRDALNPKHATNLAQAKNRISEGQNPLKVIKEEGSESLGVLKQDLFDNAKWASALMLASKIPGGANLAMGGARVLGGPVIGPALFAWAGYNFTDAYLEEATEKGGLTRRQATFLNMEEEKDSETGLGTGKYQKTEKAQSAQNQVFNLLKKEKNENDEYQPGDWYVDENDKYFTYQDFGKFTPTRKRGVGNQVTLTK